MTLKATDILIRPIMSEKAYLESSPVDAEAGKFRFAVHKKANKIQIKAAVEELFKVKVVDVNVLNVKGKTRRFGRYNSVASDWKKAVITLRKGDTLDFFEKA